MLATLENTTVGTKIETGYGLLEITEVKKTRFVCNLILHGKVRSIVSLSFNMFSNPHYNKNLKIA